MYLKTEDTVESNTVVVSSLLSNVPLFPRSQFQYSSIVAQAAPGVAQDSKAERAASSLFAPFAPTAMIVDCGEDFCGISHKLPRLSGLYV